MEKREILRRLVGIVSDITFEDEEDIDSDFNLADITFSDQMSDDFVEAVEDEFEVDIFDELEEGTLETLRDVVNLIYRRLN